MQLEQTPMPPASLEEHPHREWMERIRAGDAAALDAVLSAYWGPLTAYARRLVGSQDAAEDVVQEMFVRFWEERAQWAPSDSLLPFLYRRTRNLALNVHRRWRVRARWLEREARVPRAGPTPVDLLEESELAEAASRAIEELPPRRREVYVLARFHHLSYAQIGEVMGLSSQTVANQMSAAYASLRRSLQPYLDEPHRPPQAKIHPTA